MPIVDVAKLTSERRENGLTCPRCQRRKVALTRNQKGYHEFCAPCRASLQTLKSREKRLAAQATKAATTVDITTRNWQEHLERLDADGRRAFVRMVKPRLSTQDAAIRAAYQGEGQIRLIIEALELIHEESAPRLNAEAEASARWLRHRETATRWSQYESPRD